MRSMPAILGGEPTFQQKIPIVRPVLPDYDELKDGIQTILHSGRITKGEFLDAFETEIAQHLGVKHAIAVSSCTSGLMLSLQSMQLSGEVIVPSFTFMATVSALVWCGLRPVFVDVDVESTNLSPHSVAQAITPQTSAILAVHNFGNPADIDALASLAENNNLRLVFDAAHGFGSRYCGKPVGGQGSAQIFSLSPTKLLISGEGGLVASNDDEVAIRVRYGREYGNSGDYDSILAGLNARMPELNALVALKSLKQLEIAAQSRNKTAELYIDILGRLPGVGFQSIQAGNRSSYKDFSITIEPEVFGLSRDQLALALLAENIDTRKYYQPPVHRQSAYRHYYNGQPLPNTEWLSEHSLSFPIWSRMEPEMTKEICYAVQRVHEYRREIQDHLEI
jgi:dTDP-4-amino-4,6-dideoxygalactose transaminase